LNHQKKTELQLNELLRLAENLRNEPSVGYRDVRDIANKLIEVAERIFGPNSREKDDARVSVLSPEQLGQMVRPIRKMRILHKKGTILQILRVPNPSEEQYYRKTLSKLDETIRAVLLALR
jgi:hypothetical protein